MSVYTFANVPWGMSPAPAAALRLHGTPVRFGLLLGQPVENGLGDVLFAAPTPPQLDEAAQQKVLYSSGERWVYHTFFDGNCRERWVTLQ